MPPAPQRQRHRIPAWMAFAAGLLFAACMIAAFPPFSLWGFALLALAPLVWLVDLTSPELTSPERQRAGPPTTPAPSPPATEANSPVAHAPGSSTTRPFATAVFAAIGTIPFYLFQHWWLWPVAGPGVPILVFLIILFPLAFVWSLLRLKRRWSWLPTFALAPVLWAGLEFFRGTLAFDGYPWYFVGHPLIDFRFAAVFAALVGAIGVSFIAAACGAAIGSFIARPTLKRALANFGIPLFALGAGVPLSTGLLFRHLVATAPGATIRIGIVQTNLPQSNKMDWPPAQRIDDLLWFLEMTEEVAKPDAAGNRLDLIVWPETMFPGASLDTQARQAEEAARVAWFIDRPDGTRQPVAVGALAQTLLDRQQAVAIPMLVGAIGYDNVRYETRPEGGMRRSEDAMYNSVFSINDGAVTGRYDKVHLTPFGEVMPYISAWPWLEQQLLGFAAAGMTFELSASDSPRILEVPVSLDVSTNTGSSMHPDFDPSAPLRIATPVCFESANPALCRRLVNLARGQPRPSSDPLRPLHQPVIIVNPTNDGWFGPFDATREQHLQLARWRAIENGVPVVRAANTGISCAIDQHGRVIARGVTGPDGSVGDARVDGVMTVELSLPAGRTIYSTYGDWLGWLLMAASGLILVAAGFPRKRIPADRPESQPIAPNDR